jgi:mono/diheme cytochrome c family protein/ketosteroid isomerase-like protein
MKALKFSFVIAVCLLLVLAVLVYAGAFNVAADDPHWGFTQRLIETARERSIASHVSDVEVPRLDDAALIATGAEHYSEMCTGCHLAPGLEETELRAGLYPKPPNLTKRGRARSPEQTFWIIKHGLKMTGMPAWGVTHDDRSIWGMVAFLGKLPELSPEAYRALAAEGESGHSHQHEPGAAESAESSAEHQHSHEGEHGTQAGSGTAKAPSVAEHDQTTHSHEASPTPAGTPLSANVTEPVAVVERFFRALATGDTKSASALLDPKVLIYESGGAERSRVEYESHHLGADSAFLKTAKHKLLSRTGDATGALAWVATESRLTTTGEKAADVVSTETMVLRKTAQGWRIVHIHWSSRAQKA